MAEYNVVYRMSFVDRFSASWQIDFCQINAAITDTPFIIPHASAEPLVFDRTGESEDSMFNGIIKTTASISYYYQPNTGTPHPDTFIRIENTDWQIKIYRNSNIYWRGFLTGDNTTYLWKGGPFSFTVTATDFSFGDSTTINLNSDVYFLYDRINLGDFFNRSLFHCVGYDDVSLKILWTRKPEAIGLLYNTNGLWVHTDAFYSFTDGPLFCTDALNKLLNSIKGRMFFSDGSYWLQILDDIGVEGNTILTITPNDLIGTLSSFADVNSVIGGPAANVKFLDQSAEIITNKALYKQIFNYELQGINQAKNFDWRTNTQSPFTDWEGDNTGFYVRTGTGPVEDQFRIKIPDATGSTFRNIWNRIPVYKDQLVQLSLKAKSYLTLPAPSPINYQMYVKAVIVLVSAGTIVPLRYMDDGGYWQDVGDNVGENQYYHLSARPNKSAGSLDITSQPVPSIDGVTSMEILLVIIDTGISPDPPSGSTYYSELYPVFVRIFNDPYVKVQETIINNKKYSYVADDESLFFLDYGDKGVSNTLCYIDTTSGDFVALPDKNWSGSKTLDEIAVKMTMDQQPYQTITVSGDFLSNSLQFHHGIILANKGNMRMGQVRDKYSVKNATHALYLTEISNEGTADIKSYTVTTLTNDD